MREETTSLRGYFPSCRSVSIVTFFLIILSFTLPARAGLKEQTTSRPEGLVPPGEGAEKAYLAAAQGDDGSDSSSDRLQPYPVYSSPVAEKEQLLITNLPVGVGQKAPLGISYETSESAVKAIDKNLTYFKDRIRERFSLWLERSARYVEIMKDVLKEKGLPEDLVFLPIVESGFSTSAYSRAAAVGPWQFMSGTAKRYGLVVDWWRDERKDPVKSTYAAAAYLRDLYGMFGSWKLALAAYNAGEGRISRALKKTGAEDYWALMETNQLHSETRDYVPKYIAASMIASAPEEFGFSNLVYHEPMAYDEITLTSPADVEVIARCSETTTEEIRGLNPELRRWSTPLNVSRYTVRIPAGMREVFLDNLSRIPKNDRFTIESYEVKKGDSLKKIARKTGTPETAILAMNSLGGAKRIPPGTVLNLPPKEKYRADRDDQAEKKVSRKKGKKVRAVKVSGKKSRSGKVLKAKAKHKGSSLKSARKAKKNLTTRVSHRKARTGSKAKAKSI